MPSPLSTDFFARDALTVAQDLLGTVLIHEHPEDGRLAGRIVETEAYTQDDPAFRGWGVFDAATGLVRPEGRALDLFGPPGRAYVYLVYRRHWLLNVVTEPEGRAGCVLLRAVEPLEGRHHMAARRPAARRPVDLTNGPGKLTQAFDVDRRFHGHDLAAPPLFVAAGEAPGAVGRSARIGLRFGTDLPYRFFVERHPSVSPGVPSDRARQRGR